MVDLLLQKASPELCQAHALLGFSPRQSSVGLHACPELAAVVLQAQTCTKAALRFWARAVMLIQNAGGAREQLSGWCVQMCKTVFWGSPPKSSLLAALCAALIYVCILRSSHMLTAYGWTLRNLTVFCIC